MHTVSRAAVFGSFLSAVETLGDVDVAVELKPKWNGETEHEAMTQAYAQRCRERGRHFPIYFLAQLSAPERDLRTFLKAGSGYLEMHDYQELEQLGAESRPLWPEKS